MGKSLSLLKDGTHGSYESVQQGAWLLSAKNIINNRVVITSNDRKISENDFKKIHDKFQLRKGDVLLTIVGTIGRSAILKEANKLTFQRSVAYLRPDENILTSSNFLFSLSKSSNFQNQLKKRTVISAQPGIYLSDIDKLNITIPELKEEQDKIASIIITIDNILSLQQRKLKQLNLLQRYIKEKTLPSQKELPKLRFLTTPYNTYKFSELFKKSTKKNDGQILQNHVISVASMRWGKLPKSSSEAYMKTYFIFNKGDIAYEGNRSKSYSFGRFVANDLGNGIVSHVFSVFNSKINFNLEFLKNYINSEQVMRDPLRMSTSRTTMMTNLVLKDIAKQTLMIPSKDEQDLLGSLYKITQSMIELNEKQQQELIYLKKYLLQKLFI
ncbi:restriction endonuclease subunit S [Limosilactobacillus reuteri]|uniref:restriction endonuclease subunit S n=1 Tax=Limosilactobacillus reuteri TaxID=1598 RepID=UPI003CFC588C